MPSRILLAAAASPRVRRLVTTTPPVRAVVGRYVAGETVADAVRAARALRESGLLVTLDHLGEHVADRDRADRVVAEYLALLDALAAADLTCGGAVEVSVKPTAVGLSLPGDGETVAAGNIARICAAARRAGTTVTLDAEDHRAVEPTLRIADKLRVDFPDLGCVVQARLRRAAADCRELAAKGARVRLCKGAYEEPAAAAFTARRDVDLSYARCLRLLMNGRGHPMVATHDPRFIEIAQALAVLGDRPAGGYEFQMLYGIRPDEQLRLVAAGASVRTYVPYGSNWYGYLVRRLAERPGNLVFFLRSFLSRR